MKYTYTRKSKLGGKRTTRKVGSTTAFKKQLIKKLLSMLMTVKLYHWNTLMYSVHKTTDEVYGELNTLIDSMVEILLGKRHSIHAREKHNVLSINNISVNNCKDDGMFSKEVEKYKKTLIDLSSVFGKDDSDLLNVRDEILASLNKVSYLLTFK
jgi:DNA-binding ferritin-like protein